MTTKEKEKEKEPEVDTVKEMMFGCLVPLPNNAGHTRHIVAAAANVTIRLHAHEVEVSAGGHRVWVSRSAVQWWR